MKSLSKGSGIHKNLRFFRTGELSPQSQQCIPFPKPSRNKTDKLKGENSVL